MSPMPRGGTLTELMMQAKGISWPPGLGDKAARKTPQHLQLIGDRFIFANTGLTSGLSHVRENKPVPN